jgi:hypothetical protein
MSIVILFSRNCRLSLTACPLVTKTRISNIVVVYIDAISIHSFIYIFSKFSYKKKVHLQMSIRVGNELLSTNILLILSILRLSVAQNGCFYKVYQYPDVESYPIFCDYCCHMAIYFFMNTLPLYLYGLIKLSLQHIIILLFRVFFWVSGFLYFKGK